MRRRFAAVLLAAGLTAGQVWATAMPAIVHGAGHVRVQAGTTGAAALGWTSSNWSGYAVTTGPYTKVTSSWKVPTVTARGTSAYSSTWVGIDGFNNDQLIQVGTEQDVVRGVARYSAWWEILPAVASRIDTLVIHPGDRMSAQIARTGIGTWTISLANLTTGASFSTTRPFAGRGSSAEWIQEAPLVGDSVATLARYSPTIFGVSVNGGNPGLRVSNGGAMIQDGAQVSTPLTPNSRTGAFRMLNAGPPGAAVVRAASLSWPLHGVRLTWQAAVANGSAVTAYRIFRGSQPGAERLVATVGNVLAYTDAGAPRFGRSWYRVVAVNDVGAGPVSNETVAIAR